MRRLAFAVVFLGFACRPNVGGTPAAPASASAVASAPSPVASAENPPRAPELPKANLTFHLVAKSAAPFGVDALVNGALVYPSADPPRDALLISGNAIKTQRGFFAGVDLPKDWSFGPLDGRWPDFVLLTLANRGYRGYAKDAKLLRRSGASWSPLRGALAKQAEFSFLSLPGGKVLLLILTDAGARFVEPDGKSSELSLENEIDGEKLNVTGASVDEKGQIFVSGFIHEPPKADAGLGLISNTGGGANGGIPIVERFPVGAKKPKIDRFSDEKPIRVNDLNGAGVFSAGETTFAIFGASHAVARFADEHWATERLPIDERCSGVRDFALAKDGTMFFGTTDDPTPGDAHFRRSADGHYASVVMPPNVNVSGLYAESGSDVWIVAYDQNNAGELFYTKPLGDVVTLSGPRPAP